MEQGYFIGVDIGTYSSKGVLVTENGKVICSHTIPHEMNMPKPGHFEQDADLVWWNDFVEITKSLLKTSGINNNQVLGVGTSAIGSCVLPIDEKGIPQRPGILYGIDTRSMDEITFLEEKLGKDFIFEHCGQHLSSQASGTKVLWIKNHEPDVFNKARWFLTSEAYLVYKLTGKATIDIYTAGGYAPLFDVHTKKWIEGQVNQLIVGPSKLPQTYWSHEVVGTVSAEAARITGLLEGTPVVAGTTDAAAEALSAGISEFGDMMLMFGSSVFFIMKTEKLVKTERFWSYNFLDEGAYAFLGGMSTSGSLTTWFRDHLAQNELKLEKQGQENAFVSLARQAASSPPGSNGLIALPYFEGERTPLHDPKAMGMWFGLNLRTTKSDLYRSLLEGVAFGIRNNFEVMQSEGIQPKRILAVGGGTKNKLWLQIVADICGIKLNVPEQQIGACYGDAFLAAVGVGRYSNLQDIKHWVSLKEEFTPDHQTKKTYDAYYDIFLELYKANSQLMHRFSDYKQS